MGKKVIRVVMVIKVVTVLFKFFVPKNLLKKINWGTIKSEKVSFVPKDLRSREADVIYGAKLRNGKSIYLYFVIEFPTYVDKMMALRLYIYISLFYHKLMNENRIKDEVKGYKGCKGSKGSKG